MAPKQTPSQHCAPVMRPRMRVPPNAVQQPPNNGTQGVWTPNSMQPAIPQDQPLERPAETAKPEGACSAPQQQQQQQQQQPAAGVSTTGTMTMVFLPPPLYYMPGYAMMVDQGTMPWKPHRQHGSGNNSNGLAHPDPTREPNHPQPHNDGPRFPLPKHPVERWSRLSNVALSQGGPSANAATGTQHVPAQRSNPPNTATHSTNTEDAPRTTAGVPGSELVARNRKGNPQVAEARPSGVSSDPPAIPSGSSKRAAQKRGKAQNQKSLGICDRVNELTNKEVQRPPDASSKAESNRGGAVASSAGSSNPQPQKHSAARNSRRRNHPSTPPPQQQ